MSRVVRPLRIAHVTGERGFSGGEVQVFLLMEGLRRQGHENVLICPPGSRSDEAARARGFAVRTVPMRFTYSPVAIARTREALRAATPDIVHLHTGRANWVGGLAAATLRLPAITTRRMDRRVEPGPRTRWLYGRGVREAVAISEAVRQCLIGGGVDAKKIRVIRSAVDPEALRADGSRDALRSELGASPADVCVLVLAHLSRRKGIDVLLEAAAEMRSPARFWIAGGGGERAALEAQARDLGLSRVRFLGHRDDKAQLLAACDLFAMPSRAEGLGVAALEAMACGRPVVASRVGGLRETVTASVGRLVPPGDAAAWASALDSLVEDAELREALGRAGPARVREGHLPEQMTDAYLEVYASVLSMWEGAGS